MEGRSSDSSPRVCLMMNEGNEIRRITVSCLDVHKQKKGTVWIESIAIPECISA